MAKFKADNFRHPGENVMTGESDRVKQGKPLVKISRYRYKVSRSFEGKLCSLTEKFDKPVPYSQYSQK